MDGTSRGQGNGDHLKGAWLGCRSLQTCIHALLKYIKVLKDNNDNEMYCNDFKVIKCGKLLMVSAASFLLFLNLVRLCFRMPISPDKAENIENKSPDDDVDYHIQQTNLHPCRFWPTSWPTNAMRFQTPIEAPRGNEPHLRCLTWKT